MLTTTLIILSISVLLFILYLLSVHKRNQILKDKDLIRTIDNMNNTCVYKGILNDITIIPDVGDIWLDIKREGLVIGDGKTPIKELPLIKRVDNNQNYNL